MTAESGEATEHPQWWPAGCDEDLVRDCNCNHCAKMIQKLDEHRSGVAVDGEHATITSFVQS